MGILGRLGVLHLPEDLAVITSMPVMVLAVVLYGVEFLVDKIPFLDTGTACSSRASGVRRPSFLCPRWPRGLNGVLPSCSEKCCSTDHAAKASTRAVSHLSPEPFSKWILSVTEDGVAFVLVWLVGAHPLVGLVVATMLVALAIAVVWKLSYLIRRVFRRAPFLWRNRPRPHPPTCLPED